jgi:DNA-binding NtrC family response regulator
MKKRYQKPFLHLSPEVEVELLNRSWSGNYRELKNVLEYATALCEEARVRISHLPASEEQSEINPNLEALDWGESYPQALEKFEAWYLQKMLEKYQGRVNFSAEKLGLSKATLIAKAKKYQINTMKMRLATHERNLAALAA